MKNQQIFLAFFLFFGFWSGSIAQKNLNPVQDSTNFFKFKYLSLQKKYDVLEDQMDCKLCKEENDKLKYDRMNLQNEIAKLNYDLERAESSKLDIIQRLKWMHANEIKAVTIKIAKIEAFVAGETEKLSIEASTLLSTGHPSDSLAIYNKTTQLLGQINMLKNLTDKTEKLNALEADIQNFKLLIKLFSRANMLLAQDYVEVKNKIQTMIIELNELPSKKNYLRTNWNVEAERQKLLNTLKKYCVAYNQAYFFYELTHNWNNILDKDIEYFKTTFVKFIKLPLDYFPFIKTKIDQLRAVPEKERKKPVNPFKQVNCPNT